MRVISLADAKAHRCALLDDVAAGQEVVITRRGSPVARIVAEHASREFAATSWVAGLRGFAEGQPHTISSVAEVRDGDRY